MFRWALTLVFLISVLYLLRRSRIDVVSNTPDKVWIELPGPLSLFFESTDQLFYKPIRGEEGTLTIRSNFEHQPLIVFCPTNSDQIFCLYDSDVLIRLIEINTTKPFQGLSNESSLKWIVQSSSFDVREGTKDDWRLAIDCLERMDPDTFKRQSVRGLNRGLVSMEVYKKRLLNKVRDQADAMYQLYGGNTTMPLFRESK